jgi:glycosyltransferase involved in cell wall biosynthesis
MNKIDILILAWHQTYLSSYAGGHIRLKEFLKRFPKSFRYLLLDNEPTIYDDTIPKSNIVIYSTPLFLNKFKKYLFLFWFLFEQLFTGREIYKYASKLIEQHKISVVYLPMGEVLHLYIPAILLKRKFPHIRLVVDILNYEIPEKSSIAFFKKLYKNNLGFIRSFMTVVIYYLGHVTIDKTINHCDYVFTVSQELVTVLKKVYKKNTIDYTPSGVNKPNIVKIETKKYLGVYMGRLSTTKGITDLLAVWEEMIQYNAKAKLAIAGSCDEIFFNNLKIEIKNYGLQNNIDVFRNVDEKQKNKLLSSSQIFLHLSWYEPLFPVIGVLEALTFGLPIIHYQMPVVRSQLKKIADKDKNFIFVVDKGDILQAVQKIMQFDKFSGGEKKNISTNAKNYSKLYDWDVIADIEIKVLSKFVKDTNTSLSR